MKKVLSTILCALFVLLMPFYAYSETPESSGYLMQFKNEEAKQAALKLLENHGSLFSEEPIVSEISETLDIFKTSDMDIVKMFEANGLVEYSEPDFYLELFDYDYGQNTLFSQQWSHSFTNVSEAWEYGIYGNGVKVAVIDSGVKTTHKDLAENILPGKSYINGQFATDPTDTFGHGTKVAGIIAGVSNNIGIVGVAHRAKIVPLKVTNGKDLLMSDAAKMIEEATSTYRVDVINMSLGSYIDSPTLHNMVNFALLNDIIVVAAAGNGGVSTYQYPASYDGVISVGNGCLDVYGNYVSHYTSQHNDRVTISAPGTDIMSTNCTTDSSYDEGVGTSFSAPYVSGIAAMAKSIDPSITPAHFKELLIASANKSVLAEGEERNDYFGYGIADAGNFVEMLIKEIAPNGFISPADKKSNGEITVKITNPTNTRQNMTMIAKTVNSKRLFGVSVASAILEAGQSHEVDLTNLAGVNSYSVTRYLVDTITLSPFIKPKTGKIS